MLNALPDLLLEGVLCDMDGTLVDSEALCHEARTIVCKKHFEFQPTDEEAELLIGVSDIDGLTLLLNKRNIRTDISTLIEDMYEIYHEMLRKRLKIYEETPTFLDRLKSFGMKCVLVTGSTRKQVDIILEQVKNSEIFSSIVSLDDVTNTKPNPEPYLKAAELIQLPPNRCLVIEDSITGIKSALDAGTYCVKIQRQVQGTQEQMCRVYNSLLEIPLEQLLMRGNA